MTSLNLDVLIIGAGLSGIDAAVRLQQLCPTKTWAIVEGRERLGGTWDLFRYPGIRSDSDMYTLAYPFKPWTDPQAIAGGQAILDYLDDTAREYGVHEKIHYGQRVTSANWDSERAQWRVTAQTADGAVEHTARFVYLGTGYYDYDRGHVVDFPGQDDFTGQIVHPQFWPEGLEVAGRRVVIIGSGATAVTLLPALVADGATHVSMLQRTPTYLMSLPGQDVVANLARKVMSPKAVHRLIRAKNIALTQSSYQIVRRLPRLGRAALAANARRHLPKGYEVETHLNPPYNPWDQRLCVVPDADLFETIAAGRAEIVTDHIERFDATGIVLASGRHLPADLIVTATGLRLAPVGKIDVRVDGRAVEVSTGFVYKGLMLSDVPNLAWCTGYTNASWTLRADLAARWFCALINHLDSGGWTSATPRYDEPDRIGRPAIDLTSGYIQRSADVLPRQGSTYPWSVKQNYFYDLAVMTRGRIDDGHLEFARAPKAVPVRGR